MSGERNRPSLDELRERGVATISVEDCAALLNIGRSAAFAAVRSGQLPSMKVGRRVLVMLPALLRLLEGDAP